MTSIVKVEDSFVPFELLQKNGYFKVGTKIFQSKICALQHASRYNESVTWHFNEDVFTKINWRQRLNIDIRHLYRMRAQQLRDQYDYLVLAWSGGGDSTTVLKAFLDNGIRLDEVIIFWPRSLTKGKIAPAWSTQCENFLSEWEFSIQPQLDDLQQRYPDLTITVLDDINPETLAQSKNYNWETEITKTGKYNFVTITRQQVLNKFIEQRSRQFSNIATIFGISPPQVAIHDDWLVCSFTDTMCEVYLTDITAGHDVRNVEFFFWTRDMPELMREQVHMILDYINAYPATRKLIPCLEMQSDGSMRNKWTAQEFSESWRRLRREILYPDYPKNLLQVDKPKECYTTLSWYDWFFKHPESHSYLDSWRGTLRSHLNAINLEFANSSLNSGNGNPNKSFISRPYVVGKVKPCPDVS